MKAQTVANIKGFIDPKWIYNYIRNHIDCNVSHNIKWINVCPLDTLKQKDDRLTIFVTDKKDLTDWRVLDGKFVFMINNLDYSMHYHYSTVKMGLESYKDNDIKDMIESKTTTIEMNYSAESINILSSMIVYFGGGWLDLNNQDGKGFFKIN